MRRTADRLPDEGEPFVTGRRRTETILANIFDGADTDTGDDTDADEKGQFCSEYKMWDDFGESDRHDEHWLQSGLRWLQPGEDLDHQEVELVQMDEFGNAVLTEEQLQELQYAYEPHARRGLVARCFASRRRNFRREQRLRFRYKLKAALKTCVNIMLVIAYTITAQHASGSSHPTIP